MSPDGDMGPHAAWYYWKSSSTQIVLGCAWLLLSGNFQDKELFRDALVERVQETATLQSPENHEIHSGSERASASLIAEVLWISDISVPLFLSFALKNVQVSRALDILFWDKSL